VNIFPPSSTFKTSMPNTPLIPYPYTLTPYHFGKKHYELADWLGNVRVVINDKKTPQGTNPSDMTYAAQVLEVNDYYPFGSPLYGRRWSAGYRYGFNGKENDNEIYGVGNAYDFGDRMYDARLGRWWSVDKKFAKYPMLSPYVFAADNPILFVDVDGKDIILYNSYSIDKSTGQLVYKYNEVSKKLENVLKEILKTEKGYEFIAQFAKKGQTIAGVTFSVTGKYANHDLIITDFSAYEKEGMNVPTNVGGDFDANYNPQKNNLRFDIRITSSYESEEEILETYIHETQLHGNELVKKYAEAFEQGGKEKFEKVKKVETESNPRGIKEHDALKNKDNKNKSYRHYVEQKKQINEIRKKNK
ncbi:MAG: RHS repeat-associated core domain-containing protein, partial [Bacteroidota bacterium]